MIGKDPQQETGRNPSPSATQDRYSGALPRRHMPLYAYLSTAMCYIRIGELHEEMG